MGFKFGKLSMDKLETCDIRIQRIMNEAIKVMDFTVLEGYRGKELQNLYFEQGKSKVKFPEGKHNSRPSKAIDIAPYPIDWKDEKRFILLAGVILGIAGTLDIKIRWGGDWNQNMKFDQSFNDLPHFEIVE